MRKTKLPPFSEVFTSMSGKRGRIFDLVNEGEQRVRREVGDDVVATRVWNFFNKYNAKSNGAIVPSLRDSLPPGELVVA